MKIAYIAGPYRASGSDFGKTVIENIRAAELVAIKYWRLGYAVICPHLNTAFFDGLCPDDTWIRGDMEFVRVCDVMVMMRGFQHSSGAMREYQRALTLKKEIIFDEDAS
jgi:hypothetical protein